MTKTSDKAPSSGSARNQSSKPASPRSAQANSSTAQASSSTRSATQNEGTSASTPRDLVKVDQREVGAGNSNSNVDGLISGMSSWAGNGGEEVDVNRGTPGAENWTPPNQNSGAEPDTTNPAPQENSFQPLELDQGELLGRGRSSSPEQVTQLQEMLRTHGAEIEADGIFGPKTEAAVREFQRENDLQVDGIVGPETGGALNRLGEEAGNRQTEVAGDSPPPADANPEPAAPDAAAPSDPANPENVPGQLGQVSLADPRLSTAEQYDYYRDLIEANGGEINPDGATVLGLRGLGVDGQRHDGTSNVGGYDDTFVVLNRGTDGEPSVQTFQGATHANQMRSGASYGPDQNGNTVRGVAMLAPGNYDVNYSTGNYQGRWGAAYHVTTLDGNGYVPAYRDTNADGQISSAERTAAEQGGYQASAILFHSGKYDNPSSIGCQTLLPGQHQAFSEAVGRSGFNYTLLDANSAIIPE